jgi:hypothetical protein
MFQQVANASHAGMDGDEYSPLSNFDKMFALFDEYKSLNQMGIN